MSIAVIEKADEFVTQHSRRERPILINLAIDQGKTVGNMMETVSKMSSINFVGKVQVGMQEIELTKNLIYVQKDARKQAITLLFEDKQTLEDIGVMDRQALIITEVLTDSAKQIVEQYYFQQAKEEEERKMPQPLPDDDDHKDTSLLRSSTNYTSSNPKFCSSIISTNQILLPEDPFQKPMSEAPLSFDSASDRTMIDTTEQNRQ